ncbi:MAG: NPCBM/NEW2 domain-containing protein [Verrucomicrobiota bacterium]
MKPIRRMFWNSHLLALLASMLLGSFACELRAETVWLDDLNLRPIVQGWGKPQKNRAAAMNPEDARPLQVKGQSFEHGVGTVAESAFVVVLDGKAKTFETQVGLDDAKRGSTRASAEFFVIGDGRMLWRSGVMRTNESAKTCRVSVAGVTRLLLKVGDADDGENDDYADWADAKFTTDSAKTFKTEREAVPAPVAPYILTPPAPATPRINGPAVFGVRPGSPFLYSISATGVRPMEFSARNLPEGLSLDARTGRITGSLKAKGEHLVTFVARNALGSAEKKFRIACGETIALTPPMGWNSWNCFAQMVSAEKVKAAADAMVHSGLVEHGWTYINIDDYWQNHLPTDEKGLSDLVGPFRDAQGKIVPNARFPDMKGLVDYLHERGLKAGIYSSPGPTTCGKCAGSWLHEEQDARTFAEWGFDFLKYDWCSYASVVDGKVESPRNVPVRKNSRDDAYAIHPFRVMGGFLREQKRDIVFSLCQYGNNDVWKWGAAVNGSSWRTTGDVNDSWRSVKQIGFYQDNAAPYAKPGSWTDTDMLIVGWIGWGRPHPTSLTPDEQYTHVSLWSMLSAPLLIGCDMSKLDEFTLSLLTNDEVIAVNQDELGKQATCVLRVTESDGKVADVRVYAKDLADGSRAVGFFNLGAESVRIDFRDFKVLGLSGKQTARDLWRQRDMAVVETAAGSLPLALPGHGVLLYKFSPAK